MLSTQEAQELEQLTSMIHFQILRDHGNAPDMAHRQALSALHNHLAQMVNGEASNWQGRWGIAAPIGFGKSSAVAAFLSAAWQMGLLGNGVTVTLTAARVEQLYDFEEALLDAGIPQAEIRKVCSVLHNIKVKKANGEGKAQRASDEHTDVPVLMITQARIKQVYRRPEERKEKDLCYFLKYREEPRDLVLWDERAQVTEPVSLKLSELKQARVSIIEEYGESVRHMSLIHWLTTSLIQIATDIEHHNKVNNDALPEAAGFLPELPKVNLQSFVTLLTRETPKLHAGMRKLLLEFIGLLQFRLRVIPMPGYEGLITYYVVIPDTIENCLVLDASYSVSELTRMDSTIQNLEEAHPMLLDMKRWYGKGLKDLKDCSDLTFWYWNSRAGKGNVSLDLNAYMENQAVGGNVILEVVAQVKRWAAEGRTVLLWTHKFDNAKRDLPKILRDALTKGGINMDAKVQDKYARGKVMKEQVVVENYGRHDASNAYAYCDVVVHVGVLRRDLTDISAGMVGAKRNLGAEVIYQHVRSVLTSDSVSTLQQSNGRGQSRITVDGKAMPQLSWMIFHETRVQSITEGLKPLYPGATWVDYIPLFAVAPEPTLVELWVPKVVEHLDGLPLSKKRIGSKTVKAMVGAGEVAGMTWKRVLDAVCDPTSYVTMSRRKLSSSRSGGVGNLPVTSTPWERDESGQSLVRAVSPFKDETKAA